MEDFYALPDEELSMSLRTFRFLLQKRGFKKALIMRGGDSFFELTRSDGKIIQTHYLMAPKTSFFSGMIANDKLASYYFLNRIGVKQPETWYVPKESDKQDKLVSAMLEKYSTIVIKPIGGAHGNGVFTNITSFEEAKNAIEANSEASKIIVQEQILANEPEVRAICIDYKFIAAYARIPAQVTGDNKHTLLELVDIENKTKRTPAYRSNLAYIKRDVAKRYVDSMGLENYVPKEGERVQVVGVCNTGNGGTMEDISNIFPIHLKKVSEKIARETGLAVIGIDFFGENVIEINEAPALYHPVDGPASTICVEKYVDMISKI